MKIALIDDDREQLSLLSQMLHAALAAHGLPDAQVHTFAAPAPFLAAWQPGAYDILLLDIYMDGANGVALARELRRSDPDVALVFCSSSNDFAAQSYEVNARYYLQKPVSPEALDQMLRRLDLDALERRRSIRLPDGYQLLLRRLIYTNYVNHSVTFYLHGLPAHSLYITQTEVARLLSQPYFYAANKGSIVNFHMVRKVTADSFLMKDGAAVPISRRRYKDAREAYARFHFQLLREEADQ